MTPKIWSGTPRSTRNRKIFLPFSILASAGCSGGEPGELSDEEKIKRASSGRAQQTGQQSGQPPAGQ